MLKQKTYVCKICKTKPDQLSHHKSHLKTKIHQANKKIFELELSKLKVDELEKLHLTTNISIIVEENETFNNIDVEENEESSEENVINNSTKKKSTKKVNVKDEVDYSYLRLPGDEIIFELDNDEKISKIKKITNIIDNAHNLLYASESIVGLKALQIIMSLLFIKLIQPYLSDKEEDGKIDLLNKEHYKDKYPLDNPSKLEQLNKILGYFKDLSSLTSQQTKTIRNDTNNDAIKQMGEILKRHPITKMIYTEDNFINVRNASTIQKLIDDNINNIDFNDFNNNEDVIGEIYEHILGKYVKSNSKELGQFFTPRKLMKLILSYKKDRINELFSKINKNKKISICDPCMGTGGWLVTGYNMFNDDLKDRLNIAGGEVEPETFQYSLMNIISTLKKFPNDVRCNSSLTHVNKNKHNLILTNPPFNSSKKIKFTQIEKNFKNDKYTTDENKININDIYELKKDDPPIQFLELDTYKLEENGMCIIVLPYGEFFSGNSFSNTRTHFLKTVNITDIILVPGGIFTHTGIKTCVMIFEKNKKGTENINFLKINQDCNSIEKITTVSINDIKKEPSISWYHSDYLNDNLIFELSKKINNFEWVEFGDIFTLEKGKIQSSKVEIDEDGEGVMVTQSKNTNDYKKIKEWKLNGNNLFVGNIDSGKKFCIIYYDGKCDYTNLLSHCKINPNYKQKINIKYIYYFFQSMYQHLTDIYLKGSCNLSLDQKNISRMKIPIPPLEIQNKLITKLDSSNDKVKYMKLIVDSMKQDIETFFELTIEIENKKSETKWIEFGELFTLEKGKLQSSKVEEDDEGTGVFINWSLYDNYKKISKYSLSGENLFISTTMPNGKDGGYIVLKYYDGNCDYCDLMSRLIFDDKYKNKINIKYIYYFLNSIKKHIETVYEKGSCNKSLDLKNFNRMKIQIPSIKQQNKCIEKINEIEDIIKRWENDIDNILNNGSNKFLEYLEGESIKYEKDKELKTK
jgi:type I restriction-modification system DNA methylase subunit